jgi:hypothetical protein
MAVTGLTEIAEGQASSGERWVLRAGGSAADFGTFIETIYPDGRRDAGGMAGPPLWPGSIMNVYTGGTDTGPRRVVVRADPRVARLRVEMAGGEAVELAPVATLSEPALVLFAALLPRSADLTDVIALDAEGQVLAPQDLAGHQEGWEEFRRRTEG